LESTNGLVESNPPIPDDLTDGLKDNNGVDLEPKKPPKDEFVEEVVTHLNKKAGTKYKFNSAETKKLITARRNEGITLDDFKLAINVKVQEWKGTEAAKYLRPSTLFGNKLEGYINQGLLSDNDEERIDSEIDAAVMRVQKSSPPTWEQLNG
jgi:uncharacterized phage protein (TIGR02220 family)